MTRRDSVPMLLGSLLIVSLSTAACVTGGSPKDPSEAGSASSPTPTTSPSSGVAETTPSPSPSPSPATPADGTSSQPAQGGGGPDAICGTRGVPPCAGDLYCAYEPGANCGRADAPGKCRAKPRACTREYAPVCGCDGKTYGNACSAGAAGVGIDHKGAC